MGRRDDLWSILYLLIEACTGDLPWGDRKDKNAIGDVKRIYSDTRLVSNVPREVLSSLTYMLKHVSTLSFEDEPDYQGIVSHMWRDLRSLGVQRLIDGTELPCTYLYTLPFSLD